MAGVNKVIIVGRLGNDPEMRAMPNGDAVATLSVATSETWTDKNTGEKREQTEWHRIVFFRRQAEVCGQYLRKGSQVYVEGKLKTRKWQDQNGQDRYTTEIVGDTMQMLGGRNDNQGGGYDQGGYGGNQGGYNRPAAAQNPYDQGNSGYGYDQTGGYGAAPSAPKAAAKPQTPPPDIIDDDIPF